MVLEAQQLGVRRGGVELGQDVERGDDVVVGMVLGVGEDGVGDPLAVVDHEVPAQVAEVDGARAARAGGPVDDAR